MSSRITLVILGLCCCKDISASSLSVPRIFGPDTALSGKFGELFCEVQRYENESIELQLYKEEDQSRPFAEYTSMDGDQANFPLMVQTAYDGYVLCKASVQNDSLGVEPTFSNTHYFKVIEPVKGPVRLGVQSGPAEFFEGKTLVLNCTITAGNYISYSWLVNEQPVPKSQRHKPHQDLLYIYRSTPRDSGAYMCVASNQFETQSYSSNSSEVIITVKELVSEPEISFTVVKHELHNISALVTCQSTQGTPPITFSLYNRMQLITHEVMDRNYTFTVPVILDRHMGLQCQAKNGANLTTSQWIDLEVVSVGGPVMMHYDYDVGENFIITGLRFYCKAAKGTHLRYQWFLNGSLLEGHGTFYRVDHQPPERSILLLALRKSSAGTYHCEVSHSFDNTTTIRSEKLYVDKEVLNRLPVSVVVVVFSCFILLVSLVSACCCISVVYRRKLYGEKVLWDGEMENIAYEDELDSDEYREDTDLVEATTRIDDNYQGSTSSIDDMQAFQSLRRKH